MSCDVISQLGMDRQKGVDFVRSLDANGGTNINSAVITAIDQLCGDSSGCVSQITLLSDGQATSGVTNSVQIADNIRTRCSGTHKCRILEFSNSQCCLLFVRV